MEKIKCSTPDFAEENAKKLLALFPECENQKGEVDIDKLRQVLSSTAIEGNVERYQFTWPGKRAARSASAVPERRLLKRMRCPRERRADLRSILAHDEHQGDLVVGIKFKA